MEHVIEAHAATVDLSEGATSALHALMLAEARQDIRRHYAAEAVQKVAGDAVTDAEFAGLVDELVGCVSVSADAYADLLG